MKKFIAVAGVVSLGLMGSTALANSNSPSLVEALGSEQVRECRTFSNIPLHVTTSGGDIIPIHANNPDYEDDNTTQGGSQFDKNDLNVTLSLENSFEERAKAYLACETPFLRGTLGQINMMADLTENDPRLKMVGVFQYGFSNGSTALVAKERVRTVSDLSGATIAIDRYSPHLGYLSTILADAQTQVGSGWQEPTIVYTKELFGVDSDTPSNAFTTDSNIDAAIVSVTDSVVLTSGGGNSVGSGAEGSVRGAHELLTTKSANRVISHVLMVRQDYVQNNPEQVAAFVQSLFKAEEQLREAIVEQVVFWDVVAGQLMGDPGLENDAPNLWRNFESLGLRGNRDWANNSHPRSFLNMNNEVQSTLVTLGLLSKAYPLAVAGWNYDDFSGDIFDQRRANLPSFDPQAAQAAVERLEATGQLGEGTLIEFEINFQPNQNDFPVAQYQESFDRVVALVSRYGGAVITVEGHSDPTNYLTKQKEGSPSHELSRIRQSATNLSFSRSQAVMDTVIEMASGRSLSLDKSQFIPIGRGIDNPASGIYSTNPSKHTCHIPYGNASSLKDGDPCPPRDQNAFFKNMRVQFRMVNIEAESGAFTPANTW